ncbi:hypothetical protein HZH68_011431 [Vespula germanica]|uniref:Uncharacterized protein n=1 Tax=Vespula germanica TaxID=30212 RepID=A0A834JN41_VESGE|nr:hypothetical protein HZH68_011431 [Vespula germanica]
MLRPKTRVIHGAGRDVFIGDFTALHAQSMHGDFRMYSSRSIRLAMFPLGSSLITTKVTSMVKVWVSRARSEIVPEAPLYLE